MSSELLRNAGLGLNGSGEDVKLVIVVMGYEKMEVPQTSSVRVVAGGHQLRVEGAYRATIVGRIHTLLQAKKVEVLGIEQSADHDSFALLIHAIYRVDNQNCLSDLRKDLETNAHELGVSLKVQREELFSYMHRV